MSNDDYVAPIDHSAGSALAASAGGTVSGGLKGGARTFWKTLKWAAIGCAVVGAVIGLFATGIVSLPAAAAGGTVLPEIVGKLLGVLGFAAGGLAVGAVAGGGLGYLAAPFGAIIGAFKGHEKATQQVKLERGKAHELNAQLEAYKAAYTPVAQEAPVTNVYAPSATNDNRYNFPTQGSAMNQASPQLMAGSMQYDGALGGRQLAASV